MEIKEVKETKKQIFKIEKYPDGIDNMDKVIMDVYARHQKPLAFSTLRNEIFKEFYGTYAEFLERLHKLERRCKESDCDVKIALFNEYSDVLKVGSEDDKKKADKKNILIKEAIKED